MISTEYSAKFQSIDPNLTNTVLPVFWLEMYRQATTKQTEPIRNELYWAINLRDNLTLASFILTFVFTVLTLSYSLRKVATHIRRHRRRIPSEYSRNGERLIAFMV